MPTIQSAPSQSFRITPGPNSPSIHFAPAPVVGRRVAPQTLNDPALATSDMPFSIKRSSEGEQKTLRDRIKHMSDADLDQARAAFASFESDDQRAPHLKIRTALAVALANKQIDVAEAGELRGMLLTLLPKAERARYRSQLQTAAMTPQAEAILKQIDPDFSAYRGRFSNAEIELMDSVPFKLVFPNFMALSLAQQRQIITELQAFLPHFPNLLSRLASVANDHYGPGFQYFFIEPGENKAFNNVIAKNMAGIVMPGASVVKDPLLGLLTKKLALQQLDRGGMYTDSIKHGVFSHEFGHIIHLHSLNDDQRDQIKNLYDQAWNRMRDTQGQQGFVTEYAKTNPYEYFAEGVEHHLLGQSDLLERKDPALAKFVAGLFAKGVVHKGGDGNLLNDPERVHLTAARQKGQTLVGVAVSRESDLFSVRHFEGSITQEVALMGNQQSLIGRGSLGVKAGWKPVDQPASVYATAGGVVQAGALAGKVSVGAGGYAGVGLDYKALNLEVRQNWMAGQNVGSGTEVRLGLRFEF